MAFPNGLHGAYVALNRFGFGAKQGDLVALSSDPVSAIRDDVLARRVALPQGPDLMSAIVAIQEVDEFKTARRIAREKESNDLAKAEAEQKAKTPPDFVGPPQSADKLIPRPETPQQRNFRAETQVRIQAALDARTGFAERLVWFWSNHFCISLRKGGPTSAAAGPYEREVIRPHVFGRFEDMLLAVEKHPAMLHYLDNRQSVGPNSKAGVRRDRGLNENLARENLELHTLGVNGGYSQEDVTSLAKIITGWTMIGRADDDGELGEFHFARNRHEPGEQTLLGKVFPQAGIEQGEAALRMIAAHASTARHLATKLARHFVADEPSAALIEKLAKVFVQSSGDLAKLSLALIEAKEAWEPDLKKLRSPQEFVVASLRATGIPFNIPQVNGPLRAMGQPIWQPEGPNGYADTVSTWASPEGMTTRLDYAMALSRRSASEITPSELADSVLGEAVSQETKQAVMRAESRPQGLAILLMSPEFQRR